MCTAHIPLTRVWVTTTVSGVPVGVQTDWLSRSTTGTPPAVTRVAATTHCALTQGPPACGTSGQPLTTYGGVMVTSGCPPTVTLGLVTVGCAWPACAHCTVAPRCSTKPGIR